MEMLFVFLVIAFFSTIVVMVDYALSVIFPNAYAKREQRAKDEYENRMRIVESLSRH